MSMVHSKETTEEEMGSLSWDPAKKFRSILIFGPPGAGKGTVSHLLAEMGGIYHLSTGEIYRSMPKTSPAAQLAASYSDKGHYVPDTVAIQIWHHYVLGLVATHQYDPDSQLLLLDGIPRTEVQGEVLEQHVDVEKVVYLDVPDESILIERIRGRAKKQGRSDDMDEEVIRTRLGVYKEKTAHLLARYPESAIIRVNACQTVPQVLRDILVHLADVI